MLTSTTYNSTTIPPRPSVIWNTNRNTNKKSYFANRLIPPLCCSCHVNLHISLHVFRTQSLVYFSSAQFTGELLVNKRETTAVMIIATWPPVSHTAFSYSTYSRRHVLGYRRRDASLWLVCQVRLTVSLAVLHLAIATLGMMGGDALELFDWHVWYLGIGNESVPKIIINDTKFIFFKLQSAFC